VADRADVRCITAITHLIDRSQSTMLVQSPTPDNFAVND
jgi:hypothetical protein